MPSNEDLNDDGIINKNVRIYKGLQAGDTNMNNSCAHLVATSSTMTLVLLMFVFTSSSVVVVPSKLRALSLFATVATVAATSASINTARRIFSKSFVEQNISFDGS